MGTREELQTLFEQILGSRNVYFQPPESVKMKYPAIRYSLSAIRTSRANGSLYKRANAYEIILIDEDPESQFADEILALPYCSFERQYYSDNLNHYVFTLFY